MIDETIFQKELLNNICEYAPIGMALISLDGRLVKVNPSLCRLLGYSEEQLSGRSYYDLVYLEDLQANQDYQQELLKGHIETFLLEMRFVHVSGEAIWGRITGCILRDLQGKPLYFILQINDIREQKKVEEKYRKIEELFQVISENSQDMIYFGSSDGTCSYVSPAVLSILGYEPSEIIGPSGMKHLLPRDMKDQTEQDIQDEDRLTYQIRHKDGHYIWCETTIKKLRNDQGEVVLIVAVGRDITERKRMELRLQETDQRHKSLIKYTPVAICAFNQEGRIVDANPACEQISGYSFEELTKKNFRSLIDQEDIPWMERLFFDAFNKEVTDVELSIRHKNGSRLDLMAASSPIIVNGESVGIYVIAKDLTETKQTEELLRRSEKLSVVGELAAGIAHEIRNPLMSLRGFVQLLQREDREPGHQAYFPIMLSEVDRINMIVSELLLLAKPEKRKFEYKDIPKKLQQVITLFEAEANLRNIQIRSKFEAKIPLVCCEGDKIKQVFINIIKNALEAMPHSGEIRVYVNKAEDGIWIQFFDEGIGIPLEVLDKIGQPFYTTKESGTGLGLVVCYRIIENHQGRMRIQSEEGKGTMVEIMLPYHTQHSEQIRFH